jgi:hypothetical protein
MPMSRTVRAAAVGGVLALIAGPLSATTSYSPKIFHDTHHDESAPMRDIVRNMPAEAPKGTDEVPYLVPNMLVRPTLGKTAGELSILQELATDKTIQRTFSGVPAPTPIKSFDGINRTNSGCGCEPPDTEGDVSDQHFFQWVNSKWALYDKSTGAVVPNGATNYSPGSSFWVGFGGLCETHNDGDPIVLWDGRAQRWMVSQFIAPASGNTGAAQCFAVSTTSDPLGTYYRYQFAATYFGDYPHIGIWADSSGSQDAYLLTTHDFDNAAATQPFIAGTITAVERDKMLQGQPAAMVRFDNYTGAASNYGIQALHLGGTVTAPANACPAFVHFDSTTAEYLFWDLCLNWGTPGSSTISAPTALAAANKFFPYFNSVVQNSTSATLDSFGSNTMYRASARAFPYGAPERVSVAINHTVVADGNQGGVRWVHFGLDPVPNDDRIFGTDFESARPLPPLEPYTPTALVKKILDEGTYAPDANTRWLGSIAIDANDDIGVGYSVASSTLKPQVRITGRVPSDPASTLRDEQSCVTAGGAHTGTSGRWGDYSTMSVDPTDQCTFWFTTEYFPTNASSTWSTRICSFKFDNCGTPDFAIVADTPRRIEMCAANAPQDPTYGLRVGVLNGYATSLTLSASGFPAGVSADLSAAAIPLPPGTSTLTLTGASTLASGEYGGTVSATDGTLTHSVALQLGVSAVNPAQATLLAPADGATAVKVVPTLSWNATPDAVSYRVELSTSPIFATVLATAVVTTTSWQSALLASNTTYYWRVTPSNYCGDGTTSAVSSFTTGAPGQCPAGTTASTLYSEGWDLLTANGWTTDGSGGTGTNSNWTLTATPNAATGFAAVSNVYFIKDNTVTSDRGLISPSIIVPPTAQSVILSYDVWHNMEFDDGTGGCYDGLYLQAKVAGDPGYTYLGPERMFTDPYTGLSDYSSTIRMWCSISGAPKHAIVDLDSYTGKTLQLRFDANTDGGAAATAPNGVAIDNIKVETCQ